MIREGALKIKEISYIHAEGYSAAELKHGTFALIEQDMPIFFIKIGNKSDRIDVSASETKIRGAINILITDQKEYIEEHYQYIINIPENEWYAPILSVIPFQLIAYYIAILKNNNPDKPKNLAKTVSTI